MVKIIRVLKKDLKDKLIKIVKCWKKLKNWEINLINKIKNIDLLRNNIIIIRKLLRIRVEKEVENFNLVRLVMIWSIALTLSRLGCLEKYNLLKIKLK